MVFKNKEDKKKYERGYYKKNKERLKILQREYRKKNVEKVRAFNKNYYGKIKDSEEYKKKKEKYDIEYYKKNRKRLLLISSINYNLNYENVIKRTRKYHKDNPKKIKLSKKKCYSKEKAQLERALHRAKNPIINKRNSIKLLKKDIQTLKQEITKQRKRLNEWK